MVTQAEIARRAGTDLSTVNKILNGFVRQINFSSRPPGLGCPLPRSAIRYTEGMADRKDAILGNVCVERGWLDPEELQACLKEGAPLWTVLVRRRLIPEDELAALRAEIEKALAWEEGAGEDVLIGQFLRSAGEVSEEQLEEALAEQRKFDGPDRLAEVLLERGYVTLSALQDAIHAQRAPRTAVTCRACRATYEILRYDPGRIYLCKACTGELVPTGSFVPEPPPATAARTEDGDAMRVEGVAPAGGVPPPRFADRTGLGFGKYVSVQEIGRGTMGVVYKAWDEAARRWVALKVIPETGRIEELTRFRREVEIARALHHPNIVHLYEVAQHGTDHVISMEYVDGKTLAGQRLAPKRAAELVAVVARAVQYAHSRGIVHRDIKPHNIMIDREGKPYLMDFGLAKSLDAPSSITAVGTAMGTPAYMAPEVAIGRMTRVDRRTDVYSLGAVLYDLVTGRPPFRGTNPLDTIRRVIYEELTAPRKLAPDLPPELDEILLKALKKEKNDRYPTARHLAEALERFAAVGP